MSDDIVEEAEIVLGSRLVDVVPLAHGKRIGVTAGVYRVQSSKGVAIAKVMASTYLTSVAPA